MVSAAPDEGSGNARTDSRVLLFRPGPTIVHDGSRRYPSVRVDLRAPDGETALYRGTSLDDAADAASAELGSGDVVVIRERAYFRRFWSERRLTALERDLRAVTGTS